MKLRDPFNKSIIQDTFSENNLQRTVSAASNKDGKDSRQQEYRRERATRQQH
jgi:hypothetical protein